MDLTYPPVRLPARSALTRTLAAGALVAAALSGCGDDDAGDETPPVDGGRFDEERAFADLEAQVAIGPRPAGSPASRETAELIADRLREAGAEDVVIQRPWLNVLGTIPGSGEGVVVVGAHHDTKDDVPPPFQGANDGASGVAVLLELARTLPRPLPGPSVQLVAFDAEETTGDEPFLEGGIRGSRQYVELATAGGGQGAPALDRIKAMVLFDLVGDCDLEIPREALSDAGLYQLFAKASESIDGDPAPFVGSRSAVADDHVPFIQAGVPAVDLIDFTFGPGGSPGEWWHTPQDTLDKVCAESLDEVGEAALRAIPRIR
ncbi:MAG TPA: M28 family peptidase [Solirubrobacterales bacterium]|nr:M28 family peptidase [Solirubrobacterales bacterium]